jgi:peptidoglycan/LPS O-acetylase OafA/YrhL
MFGNIIPYEMAPYTGCFWQAWPLQIDMQLTLIIPLLAMISWKAPGLSLFLSLIMIADNIMVNMILTDKNGFKIGMVSSYNYYFPQDIITKPWTKLQNVGQAIILA